MALSTIASLWMSQPWHYVFTWGVMSGLGSGAITAVLGAAVVNRWFAQRQGLVMGLLSASTASGSLVFLPVMAWLSASGNWHNVVLCVSIVTALMIPLVWWLMPERPADTGHRRYGEAPDAPEAPPRAAASPLLALTVLRDAARQRVFWLLFGTFFVCGLTTNGLIGTHFIAYCGDRGIAPVAAAGLLTMMGLFDLIGTTASGWLTDRYDPRKLLLVYYGLRGLSLMAFPFIDLDAGSLFVFAVFYGLDWIATVPPTLKLADLWLDLRTYDAQPLRPTLSGLTVEYRLVQLYSRDAGKREAKIGFNVGQGTQDIGFRNEVDLLFTCLPAPEITLGVKDENGKPATAAFVIRDAQGRIYPSQAKRLAPDFAFHPQVYRMDGETIRLPEGDYTIEFDRGPESVKQTRKIAITKATKRLDFKVERWIDAMKFGYISGDHHIHAAGCAHYTNPTEGVHAPDMLRHCIGEDLKI
ncbi:MFS transporter, partial [uncultured Bradyrhizobium sp.]|uniref:MFS transporter n=1 Tax=uncultured Bradyrhizobium sp. TaxID=199684 RepID=UPI002603B4C6